MAKVSMKTDLSVSADQVWQLIGGFNTLPDWHPAIEKSELTEQGSVRSLSLAGGGTLIEKLESIDNNERVYTYSIVDSPLPISNYVSSVRVTDNGEKGSTVEWSSEFSANSAPENEIGLEILQEVSQIANSTLDLTETLQRIIEVIKNKLPIDACALFLIDEEREHIKLMASSGFPEDSIHKVRLKLGQGITGWVAQHKNTLTLNDALKDPRFVYFPETKEEQYHSILSVPMIYKGHCIGVINVLTRVVRNFSKREVSLLESP